jgi:hypothetical protein
MRWCPLCSTSTALVGLLVTAYWNPSVLFIYMFDCILVICAYMNFYKILEAHLSLYRSPDYSYASLHSMFHEVYNLRTIIMFIFIKWALVPFNPPFLWNSKSYNKSFGTLQTGIFRNSTENTLFTAYKYDFK